MIWGLSTGRPTSEHRGIPLGNGNAAKHRPGPEHLQAPQCCRPKGKHGCPTLGAGSSSGCPGGSAAGGRANAVSRSRRCTAQRSRTRALRRRAGRTSGRQLRRIPVREGPGAKGIGRAAHGQDAESGVRVRGAEQIRRITRGDQLGRTTSARRCAMVRFGCALERPGNRRPGGLEFAWNRCTV